MSNVPDPWEVLLEKAKDDLRVATKFRDDADVADEQVGFFDTVAAVQMGSK